MLDLIMCAGNVLVIKALQHVSGGLTTREITKFSVQKMKGVNSLSELVFQRILLKRKKK